MDEELKTLLERMETCNAEMDTALGKARKAGDDEEKAKQHRAVFAAKKAEFEEMKTELEDLKARIDRAKTIAAARELETPDLSGKTRNPGDAPEQERAKDGNPDTATSKARAQFEAFGKYMRTGSLRSMSDREADLIAAAKTATDRISDLSGDAVAFPTWLGKAIVAQSDVAAKQMLVGAIREIYGSKAAMETAANPMLSTDATGGSTDSGLANLRPDTLFMPQIQEEPIFVPSLIDRVKRVPAGAGHYTYPTLDQSQGHFGGVAFTWKATEGADKGETGVAFGAMTGDTHELSGWTALSNTALRRTPIDIAAYLLVLYRNAAKYELGKRAMHGTGVNQPLGIANSSDLITVPRQEAAKVGYLDLVNLEYAIKKGYRNGAYFWLLDEVEKHLKGQTDGDGKPLFTRDMTTGMQAQLIGYGYDSHDFEYASTDEATDAGGSVGDSIISLGDESDVVFGNPQNYWLGVEEEITIARSEHAEFKRGLIVFRLMMFAGGRPANGIAFAALTDPEA